MGRRADLCEPGGGQWSVHVIIASGYGAPAASGRAPRAARLASNVTRSYASKGFLRHVW